jgi:NADH-quinone oxidoreductase subunit N
MASYILAAINKTNRYSIEAGLKYFILGSFSSIILLFGFTLIYGLTGLIDFSDLSIYLRYLYTLHDEFLSSYMLVSFLFINVGMLFKIYASPFHF